MEWTEIPEFFEIDLSESYVLGWSILPDIIEFKLEVVLCPGHPEYQAPPPSIWACYRLGCLSFNGVKSLEGLLPQSEVRPAIDATGSFDYGNIDSFTLNNNWFELEGDFGTVKFTASEFSLVLVQA